RPEVNHASANQTNGRIDPRWPPWLLAWGARRARHEWLEQVDDRIVRGSFLCRGDRWRAPCGRCAGLQSPLPAEERCGVCARRLLRQEGDRSEEHTSELQSLTNLVCRLLLEKKKKKQKDMKREQQTR